MQDRALSLRDRLCLVESLWRNSHFPNAARQGQPSAKGSLGSAVLSAQHGVGQWHSTAVLHQRQGRQKQPVLDPAVFFHLHQENFAVSAGGDARHPLASPNASACLICRVGFTTNHVSFWLPQHCTSLCQDQLAGDCGTNSSSPSVAK